VEAWRDTQVLLPKGVEGRGLRNVLEGGSAGSAGRAVRISDVLARLPVALLVTA
jgi:maltooligosyltrehalose synthase